MAKARLILLRLLARDPEGTPVVPFQNVAKSCFFAVYLVAETLIDTTEVVPFQSRFTR